MLYEIVLVDKQVIYTVEQYKFKLVAPNITLLEFVDESDETDEVYLVPLTSVLYIKEIRAK